MPQYRLPSVSAGNAIVASIPNINGIYSVTAGSAAEAALLAAGALIVGGPPAATFVIDQFGNISGIAGPTGVPIAGSPYSNASSATLAVQNLNVWAGNGLAYIYLDPPPGSLPTSYQVTTTPATTTQIFTNGSQITPWLFTGLTNGVSYTFTVTPLNATTLSKFPATSTAVIPQVQPVAILSQRNPLVLWMSADKIVNNSGSGQPANNAAISSWLDASGNGNSATSASSSNTTMLTSWTNSKSAVAMSGTSSGFTFASNLSTNTMGSAFTIFFVAQSTLSGNTQFISGVDAATGQAPNGFSVDNNGTSVRAFSMERVFFPSVTATASTPFIVEATFPGNLYLNGTKQGTASYFLTSIAKNKYPLQIGNNPFSGLNMIGDIGTVLIYKGVLSGVDRQTIRQFLGTYYNITVTTTAGDLNVPGVPV